MATVRTATIGGAAFGLPPGRTTGRGPLLADGRQDGGVDGANGAGRPWAVGARDVDVDGYLRRLGITGRPERADVETLRTVLRAQVERVAYENVDIQLGRPVPIDPPSSVARVLAGRGGYCYHLNGALSLLLVALGFDVTWHRGGVQGHAAPGPPGPPIANHLVLTVAGLPTDECPSGTWLVDAGLGDGPHDPLPLHAGDHPQGPLTFRLRPSDVAPGGWRLDHDARGSFVGMDFAPGPATLDDFRERHEFLSTSPESGFVRTCILQRRDATTFDQLRGCTLARVGPGEALTERIIGTQAEWFEAAADLFALPLPDVGPSDRDRLWRKIAADHESWLASSTGT
jgi:arylamine N-acetyltransferase